MKVSAAIELLQQCDPNGEISVSLDTALVDGEGESDGMEYEFKEFDIQQLFSTKASERADARSDCVYIKLTESDTQRLLSSRDNLVRDTALDAPARQDIAAVTDAPVAVAVAMSADTYNNLLVVVDSCNRTQDVASATTHGLLNVSTLLGMLAEDAALTNTRPGSWEGANMQQVLDSHGY